jgi:hypothetical protein
MKKKSKVTPVFIYRFVPDSAGSVAREEAYAMTLLDGLELVAGNGVGNHAITCSILSAALWRMRLIFSQSSPAYLSCHAL